MSGGPCYIVNENENANATNQIIGVHSTGIGSNHDGPNYGTLFTHKAQELYNFAHKYLSTKRRQSQKKSGQPPKSTSPKQSEHPPKKKCKTGKHNITSLNNTSIWHPALLLRKNSIKQ